MSFALPSRARSSAALVLAGVLWGTGGLAGSLLAERAGLSPLAVGAYRLLIGGGAATLFLAFTGGLRTFPRTGAVLTRLLTVGGLFALFQASYFAAVKLSSVSMATMTTIGAAPVLVAMAGAIRRLYADADHRRSLANEALRRSQSYRWQEQRERYQSVIAALVGQRLDRLDGARADPDLLVDAAVGE